MEFIEIWNEKKLRKEKKVKLLLNKIFNNVNNEGYSFKLNKFFLFNLIFIL